MTNNQVAKLYPDSLLFSFMRHLRHAGSATYGPDSYLVRDAKGRCRGGEGAANSKTLNPKEIQNLKVKNPKRETGHGNIIWGRVRESGPK